MTQHSLLPHRRSIIWTIILIFLLLLLLAIAVAKFGAPNPLLDEFKGPNIVSPAQNDSPSQ